MQLFALPEDVTYRILSALSLPALPPALGSLMQSSTSGNVWLTEATWAALAKHIAPTREEHKLAASGRRRSERLVISAKANFIRTWRTLLIRGEALHHAIVCAGMDSQDLSVSKVRQAFQRWGPWPLVDRCSPVYNSTLLMEICRGRGVRETTLLAVASHLVCDLGADPSAHPPGGCTPLIIAACRGMPKLTAFFLAVGADPTPVGHGRFRLCGRVQTVAGTHCAAEWTRRLLEAEEGAGVPSDERRGLELCLQLTRVAAAPSADEMSAVPAVVGGTSDKLSCFTGDERSCWPPAKHEAHARAARLLRDSRGEGCSRSSMHSCSSTGVGNCVEPVQ